MKKTKKRFLMWLEDDLKELLRQESEKTGFSMAMLIRIAVQSYLGIKK